MNLRVLIFSNPLIFDSITKEPIVDKDSGFILTRKILQSLPKNWYYTWVVPKCKDMSWFTKGIDNIKLLEYPFSSSIHQSRYEFYGNIIKEEFKYSRDVDVIINNQPEVSMNFRVLFENQRREKPIILSFYHWLDCAESKKFGKSLSGYIWRQLDGIIASDYNFFHTTQAIDIMKRELNQLLANHIDLKEKIFNPPLNVFTPVKEIDLPKNKILVFNHRLNNTTNWKYVIDTCDNLYRQRQDFTLWLTDDSNIKENELLKSKPYIVIKRTTEQEYAYLLLKAHFSICTHDGYSTWNMAVIDSIMNDCIAIMPDTKADFYYNLFKDYQDHQFLYPLQSLNAKISAMLDQPKQDTSDLKDFIMSKIHDTPTEIVDLIQSAIKARIENIPKKYDEVFEYIKKNKIVTKTEWINKFWSFHANSNFQKIRWKLMDDGIYDTLNPTMTEYSTTDTRYKSFFED